jgi:hypothetical protein
MIIEPAPTGRSSCQNCGQTIAKGSIRLTVYFYRGQKSVCFNCIQKAFNKLGYRISGNYRDGNKFNI